MDSWSQGIVQGIRKHSKTWACRNAAIWNMSEMTSPFSFLQLKKTLSPDALKAIFGHSFHKSIGD